MIQEKSFEGPCEDCVLAIRAIFGHFYEKGDYGIHPEL